MSNHVRATDTTALSEILDKITLTFSNDGQKLIFIDNAVEPFEVADFQGEPQIFTRSARRRYSRISQ